MAASAILVVRTYYRRPTTATSRVDTSPRSLLDQRAGRSQPENCPGEDWNRPSSAVHRNAEFNDGTEGFSAPLQGALNGHSEHFPRLRFLLSGASGSA
jgi:hypothetical protein